VWFGLAAAAGQAADRLVVVELFTSQGCSSCPPADALLGQIADREDVLGLALHVDYWDYIGWKDQFANPAYTARQKAYARHNGKMSVYTPQMIVDGQRFLVGYKPMQLADLIQAHQRAPVRADLDLRRRGERLEISIARGTTGRDAEVIVVTYARERRVDISRGENAGRTLDYHNIVTSWTPVGTWDGTSPYRATVRLDTGDEVAVIVQEKGPGAILAASRAD